MSNQLSQHAEWLSLIEVSGPFLAETILKEAFPQGLEKIDPFKKKSFRNTYDEWRETIDSHDVEDIAIKEKIHQEWINWVIKFGLEWDEDEDGDILKQGDAIPEDIKFSLVEHNLILKPEFAVYANEDGKPYLLLTSYPANTNLEEVIKGDSWSTSPAERMAQLCRAVGTRLGIVTNGEQWLFIDAPEGGITTYASWYARLWSQEPVTLQAFYSLFNIGTIFNGFEDARKLIELLDESLKHQDEVTETLGLQVSRAVEVLVQSLDRINHDHNNKLLEGVEPTELYEAGLTLMMRLVFLLCAEERGLLLLGDETYEANYALSTLRLKLREEAGLHGEEVLSYRKNAWSRLLAIFRAVYGGVEHENMRMPALGGSLFDPDRFPFLEGREKGSKWKIEEAKPLPIDNRTVLLFLDAIQIYQGRTLSYRALDVEQIGYVYEGLLEKTVVRAKDVTLELNGSKSAKTPWVELKELASAELDGDAAVKKLLKERTKSSAGRITSDLNKVLTDAQLDRLLAACHNDTELRDRIKPYYHFLRLDAWANPLLYPKSAFMVTTGTDRRETGTHYTPKSLTESIVKETLEPIVYIGPAEGEPKERWQLKSSPELLDLKICDLAMGSGAFLVQVCRWLAERVCEAWLQEEQSGKFISEEGELSDTQPLEQLPIDAEGRLVVAKRLIAERCLYGVDINPLAVELAKLSIWLVTLSKGRPFGFLDHNLKHGDSLLGLYKLEQLTKFSLNPEKKQTISIFASDIERAIKDGLSLRKELRETPIRDIQDVQYMELLDQEARQKIEHIEHIADAMIGEALGFGGNQRALDNLSTWAAAYIEGDDETGREIIAEARKSLSIDLPAGKPPRKPFHWALEFPEVFECGGFDGIVGNPPFIGGQKITGTLGTCYRDYLVEQIAEGRRGSADFVAYFFIRANNLLISNGTYGLIAVNTIGEGNTREVGLDSIIESGSSIYNATPNIVWQGKANVVTSSVHITKSDWNGTKYINSNKVDTISSALTQRENWQPLKLIQNKNVVFQGCITRSTGFIICEDQAQAMVIDSYENNKVVFPYLNGKDLNTHIKHKPSRWCINFWDWSETSSKKFTFPFDLIKSKVKPDRYQKKENGKFVCPKKLREFWWLYEGRRQGMFEAIGRGHSFEKHPADWDEAQKPLGRVIVFATGATKYPCFTLVPNTYIYANTLCVVASENLSLFAYLSSDIHTVWAWEYGSRMKQDLRYTHGDIFETFPFPIGAIEEQEATLSKLGEHFFNLRSQYMQANNKGMTKFYNDFHDPENTTDEIKELRDLQVSLNDAVLSVYGIEDFDLSHDFHEVAYLPEGKNIRFTVCEGAREELLYQIAMLNKERYNEDIAQGLHDIKKKTSTPRKKKTSPAKDGGNLDLFDS